MIALLSCFLQTIWPVEPDVKEIIVSKDGEIIHASCPQVSLNLSVTEVVSAAR